VILARALFYGMYDECYDRVRITILLILIIFSETIRLGTMKKATYRSNRELRRIQLFSTLFTSGGIVILLSSILLLLASYSFFADRGEAKTRGEALMTIMGMFLYGVPGCLGLFLSLLTIVSGILLKKMKKWTLLLCNFVMALWLLLGTLITLSGSSFFIVFNVQIGVAMISISIAIGIYLYQMRNYFKA
jgi:hypothetical protein